MKKILAWHFTAGTKLGDGQELVVGKTYTFDGDPKLCKCGYHASINIIDALKYAPGSQVSRVELWGKVKKDKDKLVAKNRTVIWTLDATMILHEFACQAAEFALSKISNPDPKSVAAIETKRRWIRGEATDEELVAARLAAWSDAWSAARSAAWLAAWSDAWSAARLAAWSAAWSDAWSELNTILERLITSPAPSGKE